LAGLSRLGYAGSLFLGSWVPDVMAHGGGREPALPASAAEREEWGKQGQAQIIAIVKQMNLREAMDDLKKHTVTEFEILEETFRSNGPEAVFEFLICRAREEKKHRLLFDAQIMQVR